MAGTDHPSRIEEPSRRWPDFRGGQAIELPDGQTWWFYEPAACTRSGSPGWTFGAEVPPDIDAILSGRFGRVARKWGRAANDLERAAALLEAAWFLLARNYAITAEEFESIVAAATDWEAACQHRLGGQLLVLVGTACSRATGFHEAT